MRSRYIWPEHHRGAMFFRPTYRYITVKEIVAQNTPILSKIYQHPFNSQLKDGTLHIESFKRFIEQDRIYLKKFSNILRRVSERLVPEHHKQAFKHFSEDTLEAEREMLEKYLGKFLPPSPLAYHKRPAIQELPIVSAYTNYLLHLVDTGSIEEVGFCVLPCFYIYRELGRQMPLKDCNPSNPYLTWIQSYSSQQFISSTEEMMKICNELTAQVSCEQKKKAICSAFQTSALYEYQFFDAIVPQNEPKNNNSVTIKT